MEETKVPVWLTRGELRALLGRLGPMEHGNREALQALCMKAKEALDLLETAE